MDSEQANGQQQESFAEQVDRRDDGWLEKKLDRRAFFRVVKRVVQVCTFTAAVRETHELWKDFWSLDHHSDKRLMLDLFGPGDVPTVALIPAADHKWKRPPKGMYWYPLDGASADAYRQFFFPTTEIRTVPNFPFVRPEDSVGLFGSQVSNLGTRLLLGNPFRDKAHLKAVQPGWTTDLFWNVHSPPGVSSTERQQFGEKWCEPNHHIVHRDGEVFEPKAGVGWIEDDYLLITVVPRHAHGPQRTMVFAGCHGEGSLAVGKMFAQPPLGELRKLQHCIRQEPWYQALFHVSVSQTEDGEFRPSALELVDAKPLLIKFGNM